MKPQPWCKHGLHRGGVHPLFKTFDGMIARCCNPRSTSFGRYGGRGIRVCDRWRFSFPTFVADMGPRPMGSTLDRINNDGDYEPTNCRWATKTEQMASRNHAKGSRHGCVGELTETSVFVLRRVAALKIFSQRELAEWWGISASNANNIITGKTWRHI